MMMNLATDGICALWHDPCEGAHPVLRQVGFPVSEGR